MYELADTIVAVSSPAPQQRAIVRLSGPEALNICDAVFKPALSQKTAVTSGLLKIDDQLTLDCKLYLFIAPHSYTGQTVAEFHFDASDAIVEEFIATLSKLKVRIASPGEFTWRSFMNGKIDLAQAEAVNEIILCSNNLQLRAAEKLLAGRLGQQTEQIETQLLDALSLIEASLDFSTEDIGYFDSRQVTEKLTDAKQKLHQLFDAGISCQSFVDLPSVGIAGAPNAGKSRLLNNLLGQKRSIVSSEHKTTRDVLTGVLILEHCQTVLFDCAGLITNPDNILDQLAQAAAIEALGNCSLVLFCVDIAKTDYLEDRAIRKLIPPQHIITLATKADLVPKSQLQPRLHELNSLFGAEFLPISSKKKLGLSELKDQIDKQILKLTTPAKAQTAEPISHIALTQRHKQAVTEALQNTSEAIKKLDSGNEEVAAMLLRSAVQAISGIEQESVDERILQAIFSRFCVGK